MSVFWISFFCIGWLVATAIYAWARRIGVMALVDTIWTAGLGISALVYHRVAELDSVRSWCVLLLLLLWSFRLSYYLFSNRVLPGHEDPRYRALADYWGRHAARNFYFLFLIQIPLVALFLYPASVAMRNPLPWGGFDYLALVIALVALFGESLADRQLAAFRAQANNRGGVCRDGLWRYSRHPNYFFEWLHWFAYVAFAVGASQAWLAWIGPVAMYVFLRYITGVPHAERSSLKSRGDAYRHYQSTTNTFFPWIPRKQSAS